MRVAIILLVVLASSPAYATQFDIPGAACIASSDSLQNPTFFTSAGTIKFKTGQPGGLQMHCAIPKLSGNHTRLTVRYRNTGTTGRIFVGYFKGQKSAQNTGWFEVASISQSSISGLYNTKTVTFNDAYSSAFIYWIKVEMSRSNGTDDVIIYSITLD